MIVFCSPVIELPLVPLPWKEVKEGKEWEMWARNQLISVGSDLAAKFSNLQVLLYCSFLIALKFVNCAFVGQFEKLKVLEELHSYVEKENSPLKEE